MFTAAVLVAVAALLGAVACAFLLHRLRSEQRRALRAEITSCIGNHGIWVGAWLIGIAADHAERVRSTATGHSGPDGHKQIADVWSDAGARVLTHVTGPDVVSEAEACGWVEHASDALTSVRAPEPLDHGHEEVFALVYASTSPPPIRTRRWRDIQVFMSRPGLLGAAFVACPSAGDQASAAWRAAAIGSIALLSLGGAALAVAALVDVEPTPSRGANPTSRPSSAATAPLPPRNGR